MFVFFFVYLFGSCILLGRGFQPTNDRPTCNSQTKTQYKTNIYKTTNELTHTQQTHDGPTYRRADRRMKNTKNTYGPTDWPTGRPMTNTCVLPIHVAINYRSSMWALRTETRKFVQTHANTNATHTKYRVCKMPKCRGLALRYAFVWYRDMWRHENTKNMLTSHSACAASEFAWRTWMRLNVEQVVCRIGIHCDTAHFTATWGHSNQRTKFFRNWMWPPQLALRNYTQHVNQHFQ